MNEIARDLSDPDYLLLHLSWLLLIIAMVMRSLRSLRILALLSGFVAIVHLAIRAPDSASLLWAVAFVLANGILLALMLFRSRRGNMDKEERELLEFVLRVEEPAQQRRLLDLIQWRDMEVGEVLMRQGQAQPPLIYVARGAAAIMHDGQMVGVCGAGDFLGEMSLITGDPASATVEVTNPMRIAVFDLDALHRLSSGLPELARGLDHALNRGLAAKILRMNAAAGQP